MQLATKARLLILVILLTGLSVGGMSFGWGGGIKGNGNVVTKDRAVKNFTSIDVSNAFHVEISQAGQCGVQVEADENLHEYITTKVKGGVLVIEAKKSIKKAEKMTIHVTIDELNGIDASGATHIKSTNTLTVEDLTMDILGASKLTLAIQANDLILDASGASRINLSGTAQHGDIDVSGAAHAKMKALSSQTMDVEASGASHLQLNVAQSLAVEASGASSVRYMGGATITDMDVSGASKVKRLDKPSKSSKSGRSL